jgi:serine/threonine-protein kinase
MKALAKNQLNRYQSAGEMRADLQRALADQPVTAEAVMSDAERTQFIARAPAAALAPLGAQRVDQPVDEGDGRRSGLVWLVIVLVLLLVIGGAAAAIFLIGRSDNKVAKVAVPATVIGQLPDAAEATMRGAGLNPVAGNPTSAACDDGQKVAEGRVCTLQPAPGTQVDKNSTVTYSVYKAATVSVPYVEGLAYNAAVEQLHTAGLNAKRQDVDSSQAAGTVIKQNTAAYTAVAPGTAITLQVSTGKVKIPDVRGKKVSDAIQTLNGAGWGNVVQNQTEGSDKTKDGFVVAENPTPNAAFPQTQQITLTVYHYVKPTPTCTTPKPTPTPTNTVTGTGTPTGTPTDTPTTPTSTPPAGALPPCTS